MRLTRFLLPFIALTSAFAAYGEDSPGLALPWQMNLQQPVTPVMADLYALHGGLLILITVITLFVLGLLGYTCVRFSAKNNPVPSKTAHNTFIEILWTTIPILILVGIAIPSLRIHYFLDRAQNAEMTLKVVGYQWYWGYEYPDQGGINYESHIFPNEQDPSRKVTLEQDREQLKGEPRLLTVDQPAVVPVDTVVRLLVTGSDVIHSWSIPAFGVKIDAIPGRVNEAWFKATQLGTFRGQCSQLCGIWHGFMPVVVKVVSKEDFAAWVSAKKKEEGISDAPAQPTPANAADVQKDKAKAPAKPQPGKTKPAAAPAQ